MTVLPLVSPSLLGPVDPSVRNLSGRLKFTVRRHKFNTDSLIGFPAGQPTREPTPASDSVKPVNWPPVIVALRLSSHVNAEIFQNRRVTRI